MPKRNSPKDIKDLDDLNRLNEIVNDKRNANVPTTKKPVGTDITKNNLLKTQ